MKKITWLFIWGSLLLTPLSFAHFHYKINAVATLQTNTKKQLTAIEMSWVYDPTVSELMLKSKQTMDELVKSIADDLVKLNNFTQLNFDGKHIVTTRVTQYHIEKIKRNNKDQIKFSFTLPLHSPLFIQGHTLSIVHTDPGASATIFYHNTNNLVLGNTFKPICQSRVQAIQGFEVGEAPEAVRINCQ